MLKWEFFKGDEPSLCIERILGLNIKTLYHPHKNPGRRVWDTREEAARAPKNSNQNWVPESSVLKVMVFINRSSPFLSNIWYQIVIGSYSRGKGSLKPIISEIKTQNSVCWCSLHLTLVFCHSLPSPLASVTRHTDTQASTPTAHLARPFCACSCQHPSLMSVSWYTIYYRDAFVGLSSFRSIMLSAF